MPINCTIVHNAKTNDEADDTGDVGAIAVTGWLHFVAQMPPGMPALAPTDGSSGTSYWIRTFKGYLDTDGVLKNEPGGTAGVKIWANDPAFNLADPGLPYLVYAPNGLRANGKRVEFTAFVFYAPSTNITRKLSELSPVPSATAKGLSFGLPGPAFAGFLPVAGDADSVQSTVESPLGPVPAGNPVNLGLSTIVESVVDVQDIPGQVVAAVAAAPTVVAAATAAVGAVADDAVTAAILETLATPGADLTNFLDIRYAPFSVATTIGDGTTKVFTVTHVPANDVMVQLQLVSTSEVVFAKVEKITTASRRITFKDAPATNSIRVLLQPIGVTIQVADTEKPTAPSNLVSSGITGSSVTIAWDSSTDNVGVIYYNLYRAAGSGASFSSATLLGSNGLTRSYTDTSVAKSANYTYFVTAVDYSLNESLPSTGKNVTTAAFVGTNPATHALLVSDFDAASLGLSNGAAVASWAPTGGSKTDPLVQATTANKPAYVTGAKNGLAALDFNGTTSVMSLTTWALTKGVIYGVINADTLAGAGSAKNLAVYGTNGTAASYRYMASLPSSQFGLGYNNAAQASAAIAASTWYAFVAKFDGGTTGYKLWLNNIAATPTVTSASGAAMSGAGSLFMVGANPAGFPWDGKVAQIGVLTGDTTGVTDADCGQICRYLMDKFAI